jgi:RNA polymerase sigma-70 factor (ECF subfamily)
VINNQTNDKELIKAAKADLSDFTLLYKKYLTAVFRYCYNRLGKNRDLAEDITSETFVRAIEKFSTYEFQSKPFIVWLYTIAHNLIVDYYRSKKERNVSMDSMVIQPAEKEVDLTDELSREELIRSINEIAGDLPDEINHLFTLRFTEDLTFGEIGRLLEKSEASVKMQFYRGLNLLKRLIKERKNPVTLN